MVTVVLNAALEPPTVAVETGTELRAMLTQLDSADVTALANEFMAKKVVPHQFGRAFALSLPSIGVHKTIEAVGWRQVMQPNGNLISEWEVAQDVVGWHVNSALPNTGGNIVLAGHNSIYGAVFQDLHKLIRGDVATVQYNGIFHRYRIDEVEIMNYQNASAAEQDAVFQHIQPSMTDKLTLISCFPDFSTSHRVVVKASPIGQYDPTSTFMQMAQ